jgi:hypothetical protein
MEIERKISVMKLYGTFKKEDVEKAMEEVEEEWDHKSCYGILNQSLNYYKSH